MHYHTDGFSPGWVQHQKRLWRLSLPLLAAFLRSFVSQAHLSCPASVEPHARLTEEVRRTLTSRRIDSLPGLVGKRTPASPRPRPRRRWVRLGPADGLSGNL